MSFCLWSFIAFALLCRDLKQTVTICRFCSNLRGEHPPLLPLFTVFPMHVKPYCESSYFVKSCKGICLWMALKIDNFRQLLPGWWLSTEKHDPTYQSSQEKYLETDMYRHSSIPKCYIILWYYLKIRLWMYNNKPIKMLMQLLFRSSLQRHGQDTYRFQTLNSVLIQLLLTFS